MIVAYSGLLGSGKTLSATRDAWLWSLQAGGAPIASNYTLNPAAFAQHYVRNPRFKLHRLRALDDIVRFIVEGGGILIWDEMHMDGDARQATQARNILLTQWLMFMRKWSIMTEYTVQDPAQIDKRMRAVTDILTFCEGFGPKANRDYRLTRTHYRSGRVLAVEAISAQEARRFWSAYDTYEYTERLDFPSTLKAFDQFMIRCGEGAKFARGYDGDPDRAWEAFVAKFPNPTRKASAGSSEVPQPDHVRKGARRAAGAGG